ncbi:hypothetical protein AVEN_150030-1 [Araneus ventricosus]|uniref:Uncharacterized protein n=1 Tax=Araneus ventricosus TaxID=182803 RepID=A0A4Y2IQP4_ARAVE|nr:hypothetical protein AVEN_61214-1 [Araneus ventricosus]GBM80070.1 hypothetical protein AVEN_150030-1 [Araneus ventricosus]
MFLGSQIGCDSFLGSQIECGIFLGSQIGCNIFLGSQIGRDIFLGSQIECGIFLGSQIGPHWPSGFGAGDVQDQNPIPVKMTTAVYLDILNIYPF